MTTARPLLSICESQLYGNGDEEGGYSPEQCSNVDAIVDAFTPEEFAAALQVATDRRPDDDGI